MTFCLLFSIRAI